MGRYWYACIGFALFASVGWAHAETRLVRSGENLQAALDAAAPGDVILLEAGATFSGNFTLPVKSGAEYTVIRSSAPDSALPAANQRVTPAFARVLARIVSSNSMPALRTAPGTHHWKLQFLEFGANAQGYGEIIALGDGSSAQTQPGQVPYSIVLDRLYIHGDSLLGQKRGIALNARDVTIQGCHISDIKAVGQDTQAIGGWNGPGPYLFENNYLEAAGENVMLGGATPYIDGVIADGVVVRRNYVSHPVQWRSPIIPPPASINAVGVTGSGSLPAGTYAYRVVARRPAGQTNVARSTASAEAFATLTASGGRVAVSWAGVPDATEYYVYGRTSGQSMYWRVTGTSFVDTGAAGTTGAVPTTPGTVWTVKNLFELKAARNVTVEFNTFENNWEGSQPGFAIVFTPRGQGGACSWCVVENVTFQYNIIRHTGAAINVLGYDDTSPTLQTRNIIIRHNLFYDVNPTTWGGGGYLLLLGDAPRDITVDHNTIVHTGTTLVYAYGGTQSALRPVYGFRYTNNLAKHNQYGLWSQYFSYGMEALTNYYPGAVVAGNLLSGGLASRYPPGNYFDSNFLGQFVDPSHDDYRLAGTSPFISAATDGTRIGADVDAILAGQGAPVSSPSTPATPAGVVVIR